MKNILISIFIFYTHSIFAQLDKVVRYIDGTVMNYDIRKNDPELFPNINAEVGGSLGRLTYSPLAFNLEAGLRMKFKRYGIHIAYSELLIKYLMEDVIISTKSDNKVNNYNEFKAGVDLDIWSKIKFKNGKINLKTTKVGRTEIAYMVNQDSIKRKKQLSIQTGYLTHNGAISNGMRKKQSYYLTDVNGFALVQNRPEITSADVYEQRECVSFHTNLRAHHLYFGLNYSIKEHIIAKYISNRGINLKTGGRSYEWVVFGHFMYNIVNNIDPIILNDNVYIYSPVNDRLLYILPSGVYDVQHSGEGGFVFSPFGWKIGTYLHISNVNHPLIPGTRSFIELGVLPGLKGHQSLGADVDMGRFFLKFGVMISMGINTSKKSTAS